VNNKMNDEISFTPTVTSCYQVHADAHLSATLLCYLGATGGETSLLLTEYCMGGQLFLLLNGHFEKAAFSGEPCLLMRVETVLVHSLSTNIYYDYEKLEELSNLKIFLNASAGH